MIKRDLSLYLVTQAGARYKVPIYSDVRYAQTFSEEEIRYKTLHNPENLFNGGFTAQYNPGSFEFTTPLMDSTTARALFSIFFQKIPTSFSLFYVEDGISVKLNTCVVDRITFNFDKNAITTASISGQYSFSELTTLTGTAEPTLGSIYTYIEGIEILLGEVEIPNLTNFSLEMSNEISWLPHNTMHNGVSYPTEYYCSEKVISGNFSRNEGLNLPSYNDSIALSVKIKSTGAIFLEFILPSVINTTRPELDDIIKRGYDFRVNGNVNNEVRYKGVNIL